MAPATVVMRLASGWPSSQGVVDAYPSTFGDLVAGDASSVAALGSLAVGIPPSDPQIVDHPGEGTRCVKW